MTNAPMSVPAIVPRPPHERRAAEHDGRDRVELERLARGRVRGAELGRDNETDEAGAESGDHVDEKRDAATRTPARRAARSLPPTA